ncbi:MAG: transcription antitermination factor NusB [Firmicutes bacterium]|nr:transcription antitermination factor NusB [Bacillota bacterium]
MTRVEAREYMMTVAFQMDALNSFDIDKTDKFLGFPLGRQKEYCSEVFSVLCNKKDEIDEKIQENCIKWDVKRMPKTDVAILRVAVAEILYSDVPASVAVNEAVDLAKKYSEENSPSYINGILASIVKQKSKSKK